MNVNYTALKEFLKKHIICELSALIGLAAGPSGFFIGLASGVFIELIVFRLREEKGYRNHVEKGAKSAEVREPFPGAVYVCALGVYSCSDSAAAARQAKLIFGKKYRADWNTICRSSAETSGLNGDLIAEYLASELLKALKKGEKLPLQEIFKFLTLTEFNWDAREKGEKPSLYLAQLLNYRVESDDISSSYEILGLKKGAPLKDVKKAHRKLAAKYHPDTGAMADEGTFIRIQKAYETISKALEKYL